MANEVKTLTQEQQTLVLKDIFIGLEKLQIVGSSSNLLTEIKQQVYQLNLALNAEINMKEQAAREMLQKQTAELKATRNEFAEKLKAKQEENVLSNGNGISPLS